MILPKEKYQKTVKRQYPPLLGSLVLTGITDEKVYEGFLSKPYARKDSLLCDGVWYNNGEVEDLGRNLIATEWINNDAVRNLSIKCRELEQKLMEATAMSFDQFSKAYENYMATLTLVFLAEDPFYGKLKEALMSKVTPDETKVILEILNAPLEDNFHKIEQLDLIQATDLKKHIERYSWFISRNGANTPYTIELAKQRLSEINKEKFIEEYNESKKDIKDTILKAKNIIGKEFEYLVDGLQFIVFYRTHRTDVMSKVIFLYIPILKSVAYEFAMSYEDILFCLESEILSKKLPNIEKLEERKKGYAIASINNEIVCFSGNEFEELRDRLEDEVELGEEIKGNTAFKGGVSGIVKIINGKSDFNKIEEGDVLVSSMTTPEMLPIMQKSVAFVTDEGGITCHAAIIARELKKPCIIGTKIATKVLKDGDLVEVDANTGVIKILERAK